jgi:AcrR family transcriptional regulator
MRILMSTTPPPRSPVAAPGPAGRPAELAARVLDHLLTPEGGQSSFRALAAAAEVSRPTLAHHFGDHQGALAAAIAVAGERGRRWTRLVAELDGAPEDVLGSLLRALVAAWRHESLGRLHRIGIREGLGHEGLGLSYVQHVLEPTLAAFERRLAAFDAAGALRVPEPRSASLRLLSPVLLALLHQVDLGGGQCRPLDLDALLDDHLARFLRDYAVPS